MKSVNEVLTEIKGEGNADKILTGKGSFSEAGYDKLVHALVNDTTHKVPVLGKDGKETYVCISDIIRADLKKTIANAKYPQKSELNVIDTVEIETKGLAKASRYLPMEQIKCGKKFTLPPQKEMNGDIYLAPVAGKTKTIQVRDIKTKQELGTTTITSKDSIQVRVKSPVPKHLQSKVRKDLDGNIVK